MTKEELHIKAIDNANSRVQSIDKRYITSLADYDLGLIQGFEDGVMYMKGLNDGKALLYAVNKTAERTKREVIEKAVKWLDEELMYRDRSSGRGQWGEVQAMGSYDSLEEFINDFKQAMKDESRRLD